MKIMINLKKKFKIWNMLFKKRSKLIYVLIPKNIFPFFVVTKLIDISSFFNEKPKNNLHYYKI